MFEKLIEAIKGRFKQFFHWFLANDMNWDMDKKYATYPIDVRMKIAKDPTTNPNDLAKLAKDSAKYVQIAAARNPSTPINSIDKLAYSNDVDVVKAALSNPSICFTTINKFYSEGKYLETILKNPVISPKTLLDNISSNEPGIKMAIIENPKVTEEILAVLAQDKNNTVATYANVYLNKKREETKDFRNCDKHIKDAKQRAEIINNDIKTKENEKENNKNDRTK